MTEKEKEAVESLRIKAEYIGDNYSFGVQGIINLRNELSVVLNLIEKQQEQIENSVSKDKIRETIDYLDTECSHNFDNEYWVTMGAIRNKFDELLEE